MMPWSIMICMARSVRYVSAHGLICVSPAICDTCIGSGPMSHLRPLVRDQPDSVNDAAIKLRHKVAGLPQRYCSWLLSSDNSWKSNRSTGSASGLYGKRSMKRGSARPMYFAAGALRSCCHQLAVADSVWWDQLSGSGVAAMESQPIKCGLAALKKGAAADWAIAARRARRIISGSVWSKV